ncbi:hypothetical protein SAMN05216174_103197 [Actinokineospora iranica]|uniref:Uncharacterized protein n=1 Tax=Actinokineospora iranica TaxID=1271860 RepID=A0A1G6N4V2_9PSEU|nr:hypothetical protein SAMN05216174_103197 [Actinokineospora iranica]
MWETDLECGTPLCEDRGVFAVSIIDERVG